MTLYFAYGSNMCSRRLRHRVPSARAISVGRLEQHELRFHKLSADGSGKCDAYSAGVDDSVVHGVLFEFAPAHRGKLDRVEGLGTGYFTKAVTILTDRVSVDAFTYYAHPDSIRPNLRPYTWYHDFVLGGAEEHALPREYIDQLRLVKPREDPDKAREAKERLLLPCQGGAA